jgi:hypothetical protein
MVKYLFTIYVQNWKAISRKSDTTAYESSVREFFDSVVDHQQSDDEQWRRATVESVEYNPNYSTPDSYSDYLDDKAWTLWSAAQIAMTFPDELEFGMEELETRIAASFGTNVHLNIKLLESNEGFGVSN